MKILFFLAYELVFDEDQIDPLALPKEFKINKIDLLEPFGVYILFENKKVEDRK